MKTHLIYTEECIDLTQEFLPANKESLQYNIYRFNIYKITPNCLFPAENIHYYSIQGTSEQSFFGVKWDDINGKLTLVDKQINVLFGDNEIQQHISNELENILKKQITEKFRDKTYVVESAMC